MLLPSFLPPRILQALTVALVCISAAVVVVVVATTMVAIIAAHVFERNIKPRIDVCIRLVFCCAVAQKRRHGCSLNLLFGAAVFHIDDGFCLRDKVSTFSYFFGKCFVVKLCCF